MDVSPEAMNLLDSNSSQYSNAPTFEPSYNNSTRWDLNTTTLQPTSLPSVLAVSSSTALPTEAPSYEAVAQIANPRQFNYIALALGLSFLSVFIGVVAAGFVTRCTSKKQSSAKKFSSDYRPTRILQAPHALRRQKSDRGDSVAQVTDRLESCFQEDSQSEDDFNELVSSLYPSTAAAAATTASTTSAAATTTTTTQIGAVSGRARRGGGDKRQQLQQKMQTAAPNKYLKIPSPQKSRSAHHRLSPLPTRVVSTQQLRLHTQRASSDFADFEENAKVSV